MERVPGSACNDALGVDRVALLFLTRAVMYHDQLWRRWLEDAAGLLPAQALQARACSTIKAFSFEREGGRCTASGPGSLDGIPGLPHAEAPRTLAPACGPKPAGCVVGGFACSPCLSAADIVLALFADACLDS